MSHTEGSVPDPLTQELSTGSGQTVTTSRLLQPIYDPSASKRVCFYKSGDNKFSGHRMVINARTFKTFDALLDALSKKVPLPFGVRTITTPRGIHLVKGLDDLHDGGSYVCSDQKRVKPLNLNEVNRRQVPWNTTRPVSGVRRRRAALQLGTRIEVINRPAKINERVAVRTPKRLVVIKNRDPTVKRTIVLQRRTAPTFEALLDYLSQILQFPVLKLYSTDGRRVDGLAALILCSGIIVAASSEPFRLANYFLRSTGQMAQEMFMETVEPTMLQPQAHTNKSYSVGSGKYGRGSRNFSLSSERYIINQINNSQNGSIETEVNERHRHGESHARVDHECHASIVPQDDDIEKSFRVNQDGSMTVEMKVRLTIKEEELLHWTTTLSRSSLKRTVRASMSELGTSSPDSNNGVAKDPSEVSDNDAKEENHPTVSGKGVGFSDEPVYEGYSSTASGRVKSVKRTPTPGPRHVKKKTSVESVTMVTESGVQESTTGHYSYMERTADGETTEEYCLVTHSSGSSRPVPKPRKTASTDASKRSSRSSVRSSGVAEVLQIENNGMEVRETVMHIYESRGCYHNYVANEEYSVDGSSPAPGNKLPTESGSHSTSNDCDIDFSLQAPTADSRQRQNEEMLSLSSEPLSPKETKEKAKKETKTTTTSQIKDEKKTLIKPTRKQKRSPSTSVTGKKQNESTATTSNNGNHSSSDKISSKASAGKKSVSSSAKSSQKSKEAEKPEPKKFIKGEKTQKKEIASVVSSENMKRTPPKKQNITKAAANDNGINLNTTATGRPQMKKNLSDILQPKKTLMPVKKQINKSKSGNRLPLPKASLELNESVSMPCLNPSPPEIHQYVENWLEKVTPDPVPYMEEADEPEPRTNIVFKLGANSESEENSDCQTNPEDYYPGGVLKSSASFLSAPLGHKGLTPALLRNDKGLCASMPSFRVEPAHHGNLLSSHKSVEALGPADQSTSNLLSPKAKIEPVLRHIRSSIQSIRMMPDTLSTSKSLPDFSTQVTSVFGSSCKAFLSFLSVMTLRDNLVSSTPDEGSRSNSEAMLMMESLQKISAIDDQEEQKASLTDLQNRASSEFKERWRDFQILRERLESEPLSPKFSETEFALDLASEGGDVFEDQPKGLDELMDELNMPQDLRAAISSTIQAKSFYPVDESTFVDTEKHFTDSDDDLEQFVEQLKQSPDPERTCTPVNISERKQDNEDEDPSHTDFNEMQRQTESEAGKESGHEPVEKEEEGTEKEMTVDEDEEWEKFEKLVEEEVVEQTEDGFRSEEDEQARKCDSEPDERNDVEETKEEEEKLEDKVEEEEEEVEKREKMKREALSEKSEDEGEGEVMEEIDVEEEAKNNIEVQEEEEEGEFVEEPEEVIEQRSDIEHITEEIDERAEEVEDNDKEEEEEEEEDKGEEANSEENKGEEEREKEEEEKEENGETAETKSTITDEEEEKTVTDNDTEEEEEVVIEEMEIIENMELGETIAEEERDDDEENESTEGCNGELEEEHVRDDADRRDDAKILLEQALYLRLQSSSCEEDQPNKEEVNIDTEEEEHSTKSPTKYSCVDDKGTDTSNEFDTDGGGERYEASSHNPPHPVEISQELLDFINSALQSSSLIFAYDDRGNIRIEADNARVVRTSRVLIPKSRNDSLYGLKRLPSPNTSDLSDYRPETSESGGYKTLESVDIISESSEEGSERPPPVHRQPVHTNNTSSKKSKKSNSRVLRSSQIKNEGFSSSDSGTKVSREDLSYFSAASSLKADVEAPTEAPQCTSAGSEKGSNDGVLIDQGRWLLKENHLIRKSPPVSLRMYGHVDSTSIDTGQENTSEGSLPNYTTQNNPLASIASSELEEMAKPQTPKCTYYNMPHGSDSDPFLDTDSLKSRKDDSGSMKGRGVRVAPTIDTSRTWANKNGSLSSFASVEFNMQDRKVHPEGESSAVTQARRTSSARGNALQSQNSLDALRVRCGQFCPIL